MQAVGSSQLYKFTLKACANGKVDELNCVTSDEITFLVKIKPDYFSGLSDPNSKKLIAKHMDYYIIKEFF